MPETSTIKPSTAVLARSSTPRLRQASVLGLATILLIETDYWKGGWGAVSLAFTPTSGLLYELTATISSQYWGSWIGVGFLPDNSLYGWSPNNPVALRTTTGWVTSPQAGSASLLSNDVLVRLDTTGANWTTSIYQGGTQIGTTFTYTTNPTINRVGFVSDGSGGNVSAFQLTAIPEPSAYSLVLGGVMSLLLIRRWRK